MLKRLRSRCQGENVVPADALSGGGAAQRLAGAIDDASAPVLLILPNHQDLLAEAERMAAESANDARVVAVPSIAAGLAAATAFNPEVGVEENVRTARQAAAACRSAEADPESVVSAAQALVEGAPDAEILTLIAGAAADADMLETVAAELRSAFPALKVDTIRGDQPGPAFVIGLE